MYIDIVTYVLYTYSLILMASNGRAVVDETVDIDDSIQMEFIITAR